MSDTWYYADQNKQIGPMGVEQLKAALQGMPNARDVLVWRAGMPDWKRAGELPELAGGVASVPPVPFGGRPSPVGGVASPAPQPSLLELFLSFSGRINRAKYWGIGIFNVVIMGMAVIAGLALDDGVLWIIVGLILTATFISAYAIGAKRLHDRDKSAWWLLFYYILPGIIVAAPTGSRDWLPLSLIGLISLGISIAGFVDLGCLRGTVGDNRFGPDPLAGRM